MMIERDSSNALTVDGSSLGVGVITSNPTSRSFGPSTADSQLRRGTPEGLNRLHRFNCTWGFGSGGPDRTRICDLYRVKVASA
jgi:hypothetical protein